MALVFFREARRGRSPTGHGSSLRGWRTQRLYYAADRISVVVLFNRMADARAAALELLDAVTGDTATVYGNKTDLDRTGRSWRKRLDFLPVWSGGPLAATPCVT